MLSYKKEVGISISFQKGKRGFYPERRMYKEKWIELKPIQLYDYFPYCLPKGEGRIGEGDNFLTSHLFGRGQNFRGRGQIHSLGLKAGGAIFIFSLSEMEIFS